MRVENRQEAARELGKILSASVRYMGPPTFAYGVGPYSIDREGYVSGPSDSILEELRLRLIGTETASVGRMEVTQEKSEPQAMRNLIHMIHSKQYLISRALGYRAFDIPKDLIMAIRGLSSEGISEVVRKHSPSGISAEGNLIKITGLPEGEPFEMLAEAMIRYCGNRSYIMPDETMVENEKYYMRAWLVRIGLNEKCHKRIREIMLKNLKGHTAFRTPADAAKWRNKHMGEKDGNRGKA